jgi:hypothetical protein
MKRFFPNYLAVALFALLLSAGNAFSNDVDLLMGDTLKINFQPKPGETNWPFNRWPDPANNPVPEPPAGYFWCDGSVSDIRDNGFYYGFKEENKKTRWRPIIYGPERPDSLLFQSFNHLQNGGTYNVWECEVPNGFYNIMLVCGDPDYGDFISTVNINGKTILDPTPIQQFPSGGGAVFDTLTAVINVTNGMLTFMPDTAAALGDLRAVNVKFAYLHIWKFEPTFPEEGILKINFQPTPGETSTTYNKWPNASENPVPEPPAGYLWDDGSQYGYRDNGYMYGFKDENKKTRWRNVIYGTDRPDSLLYQAFNHLQNNNTYNIWEIALPNGKYDVTLVCGDPNFGDFISTVNIEGTTVLDPTPVKDFLQGGKAVFDTLYATVNVTDGRLTLRPDTLSSLGANKADNVKFAYVHIATSTVSTDHIDQNIIGARENLRFYPNPVVNGTVTIEHAFDGDVVVKVYNLLGRLVAERKSEDKSLTMDLSSLPKGLYLITVNDRSSGKLIVK